MFSELDFRSLGAHMRVRSTLSLGAGGLRPALDTPAGPAGPPFTVGEPGPALQRPTHAAPVLEFHINEIKLDTFFCVWLLSRIIVL